METIAIKINADGSLEYSVSGIKGRSCKEVTKLIDKIANVTESKNTAEYCALPTHQAQQQKQGA